MKLTQLKLNPKNPRIIKDDKFEKLCQSIETFPEMLEKRPIVCVTDTVDGKLFPLGGNMRLKALQHLKRSEIPDSWVVLADDWTQEQRNEFTIKDNLSFGEWDMKDLSDNWDADLLEDWGMDMDEKIDNMIDGDTEVIEVEKSLQVLPKMEYVIIYANSESDEWAELKSIFKCKTVRQGGCKIGSTSDKATQGTERVFDLKTFKERIYGISDSNTE